MRLFGVLNALIGSERSKQKDRAPGVLFSHCVISLLSHVFSPGGGEVGGGDWGLTGPQGDDNEG